MKSFWLLFYFVSQQYAILVSGFTITSSWGKSIKCSLNRQISRRPLAATTDISTATSYFTNLPNGRTEQENHYKLETDAWEKYKLPVLSKKDKMLLELGERVQMQYREGRIGRGMVVLDVAASLEEVYETLSLFDRYDALIPTVRSAKISNLSATSVAAEFALSKFRLKVNVVMKTHPEENAITFRLDKDRPNLVMREAEGFWLVESPPDRPGYTRVWLGANIVVSRLVPTLIVDYAAARALPRATSWLHSYFPAKVGQVE